MHVNPHVLEVFIIRNIFLLPNDKLHVFLAVSAPPASSLVLWAGAELWECCDDDDDDCVFAVIVITSSHYSWD